MNDARKEKAAIAFENARLLNELQHRTEDFRRSVDELRALGEICQAVSSTLELDTVLFNIVAKAVQLSRAEAGAIYGYDEWAQEFRLRATVGMDPSLIEALNAQHIGFEEPNVSMAFERREPVQAADLREEAQSEVNDIILHAGYRARLLVPLLHGSDVVGMLVVRRKQPGLFTDNIIELTKAFATQSTLAFLNAQLFESVETQAKDLAKALQELRATQDRLVQTQKLASLGQLTAGIAHEIKNPLNFVINFASLSIDLID